MVNFVIGFLQDLGPVLFLCSIVAVFAGAIMQGSTGLGFGMVSAPALLLIDPLFVPGPILMLAMIISLFVVVRDRKNIEYKTLGVLLGGRIPGTILAAMAFSLIPLALYGIIFGILVLVAVLLTSTKLRVMPTTVAVLIASFSSGFMGTLTSVGAPPMALVFQHGQSTVVRPTLATFFLIGCLFSLIVLFYFGGFSAEQLYIAVVFIPVLFAGFKVSSWLVPKLNQRLMRIIMLSISGISAIVLIIRSSLTYFSL